MRNFKFFALVLLIFSTVGVLANYTPPDVDVGTEQTSLVFEEFESSVIVLTTSPDFQVSVEITFAKVEIRDGYALYCEVQPREIYAEDHYKHKQIYIESIVNVSDYANYTNSLIDYHINSLVISYPLLC